MTWAVAPPLVAGTLAVAASQMPQSKKCEKADAQANAHFTTALLASSAVSEHLKKHTVGMHG